jgi:hypothetical protein
VLRQLHLQFSLNLDYLSQDIMFSVLTFKMFSQKSCCLLVLLECNHAVCYMVSPGAEKHKLPHSGSKQIKTGEVVVMARVFLLMISQIHQDYIYRRQ